MICKWCGETLNNGAKTCSRCRREVPPLSDCGGFYDLVPGAMPVQPKTAAAPVQTEAAYSPEVQPIAPVLPDHARQRSKRNNLILAVVLLVAVALLINTIVLNGKLSKANETIEQLQSRIEKSEEQEPKPQQPSQGEDPTEDTTEENSEEATIPTMDGKEEEESSGQQGNQKEDNVITVELPENSFELTQAQASLLQTEPLFIELEDPQGEVVVRLYLELDHEANELTLWMLEGMDLFENVTMTWKVTRTGAELAGEQITSAVSPAGAPQLEWGETEEEPSPVEYRGCRLNIENYSVNSLLECQIQCLNGEEAIVNITIHGVTLQ